MKLLTIGTGSSGNCYALEYNRRLLLLDAGLPSAAILKGIDYRVADVVGCLITHEHGDHCRGAAKLNGLGIRMEGTAGTREVLPYLEPVMRPMQMRSLGPWTVMDVPMVHDAKEPCGWLVYNTETSEKLLYATDTSRIDYSFPGLHYWLVECNYCRDLMGDTPETQAVRLLASHMSLENLEYYLKHNAGQSTRDIVLCHTSRIRGDAPRMVEQISKATGKFTTLAVAGTWIDLSLEPF